MRSVLQPGDNSSQSSQQRGLNTIDAGVRSVMGEKKARDEKSFSSFTFHHSFYTPGARVMKTPGNELEPGAQALSCEVTHASVINN